MSTRKIFNIVNSILAVMMIAFVFLPFIVNSRGEEFSFWNLTKGDYTLPIVFIIELLGLIAFYVLQIVGVLKNTKDGYPLLGFGITYFVANAISGATQGMLDYFRYGFWLLLLGTVVLTVMSILANYMSDDAPNNKQAPNNGYGYYPPNANPYGYGNQQQNNGYYPQGQANGQPNYNGQQGYNNSNGQMYR